MEEHTKKRVVLDASVFFTDLPVEGECYTTPAVLSEIKTQAAKMRLALLEEQGLRIHAPGPAATAEVAVAARKSGDATVLSETDTGILALARELDAAVMTDDFAVQNTAQRLGVPVIPILQRRAKKRTWKYRCTGCGRYWSAPGVCQVCGAEIRRAGSGKKY
ncbi:NOB1 family endonuclease [Methanogenium organophilum]|uniref:Endoribonuclease Nob1 n=1 Tax=Methanogenium organophilum TaxID=2199 RepID=A0A9X9T933_METOG|nr:nucleotide-binding protein [Methanogenium organophilum]WAI02260.1 nucleotide-binding protein [Methanogenium organophilum]